MAQPSGLFSSLTKTQPLVGEETDDYASAIQDLKASLEARKNQMFDPVMLAMAQGFLAPTKSGGFGESIGTAAGLAGPAIEKQQKSELENAQMRLQLAQMERAQAQKEKAAAGFNRLVTGEPATGAGTIGGAAGAPTGAPAPAGAIKTTEAPKTRDITMSDALRYAQAFPEEKEFIKLLTEAAKMGSERYKIAMNGTVFDTLAGQYLNMPIPGQTQSEFFIPELKDKVLMLPSQYSDYLDARKRGEGKKWIEDYMRVEPVKPAGAGEVETAPSSTALATKQAREKAEAEAVGAGAGKRTSAAMDMTQQALDSKMTAQGLKELAGQEGMDKVLGIFEHPTIKSSIAGMVENSKFAPEDLRSAIAKINIELPRKANETPEQFNNRKQAVLDRYYQAASLMAQLQFQASMLAKGQGAISNNERQLFADTTISKKDTINTLNKKADMIIARSDFVQKIADTINDKQISLDAYKRSPEYKRDLAEYERTLRNIWSPTPVGNPAAVGKGVNPNAAADLRKQVGLSP